MKSMLVPVLLLSIFSCSTHLDVKSPIKAQPHLAEKQYTSFDGDVLGYQKWRPPNNEAQASVKTVIIGVHGISGHAGDYQNLAEYLRQHNADTALYAAETRGQGMDPEPSRRGDIRSEKDWYQDLYTFTRLVRNIHPKAKIVWFGESMGSLIVLHAYGNPPAGEKKPDALVLSSPIVGVAEKLPPWKRFLAHVSAALLPKIRISLETLSDGQRAVVTEDDIHQEQAAKNPWYISQYTLRLLNKLGKMSDDLDQQAAGVSCPVLVLHGGKDIFTSDQSVDELCTHFPGDTDQTKKFYSGSYHLLMYDHEREKIFNDVSVWLTKIK